MRQIEVSFARLGVGHGAGQLAQQGAGRMRFGEAVVDSSSSPSCRAVNRPVGSTVTASRRLERRWCQTTATTPFAEEVYALLTECSTGW
jgi:hypothetical protein